MTALWQPTKQSPVHHQLIAERAVLTKTSGGLVAEHFGNAQEEARVVRSGVGLCDLSSVQKWEIKGTELSRHLASVLGGAIPHPGGVAPGNSGALCRVSRFHALFVADQGDALNGSFLLNERSSAECFHVTDRTSGLANFLLCGPRARDVLGKLTSLDLREDPFPNLRCACGPVAAIQALMVREDRGHLPGYQILFSREYGEYLWGVVRRAGEEFQLRPFGAAAMRLLEQ